MASGGSERASDALALLAANAFRDGVFPSPPFARWWTAIRADERSKSGQRPFIADVTSVTLVEEHYDGDLDARLYWAQPGQAVLLVVTRGAEVVYAAMMHGMLWAPPAARRAVYQQGVFMAAAFRSKFDIGYQLRGCGGGLEASGYTFALSEQEYAALDAAARSELHARCIDLARDVAALMGYPGAKHVIEFRTPPGPAPEGGADLTAS